MGAFIARQPNGLYCRFSTVEDTITDYNMSEHDYIMMCVDKAKFEAKRTLKLHTKTFQRVIAEFRAKGIHKKKYFSSKKEASKWYLKQKQQYIITLANDYYSKKLIHKRAHDGMLKYALKNLV